MINAANVLRGYGAKNVLVKGGTPANNISNTITVPVKNGDIVILQDNYKIKGNVIYYAADIEIPNVTNIYSQSYANDAIRRNSRFYQKIVRDVDLGNDAHTLHSEASYSASAWPEIIWFYCNIASPKNGATILCDGQKLWKNLSSASKTLKQA